MKANEFVKKFGWGKSIELIEFYNRCGSLTCDCDFTYDELKRLVESHELIKSIESIGGLDFAIKFIKSTGSTANGFLEQAIADVESCQ